MQNSPDDIEVTVRRISAMTVLPDIAAAVQSYADLGCPLHLPDPLCTGVEANKTYHILVAEALLARQYPDWVVRLLSGRTIPYVYVASVTEVLERGVEIVASCPGEAVVRLGGLLTMLSDGTGGQDVSEAQQDDGKN